MTQILETKSEKDSVAGSMLALHMLYAGLDRKLKI